MQIDYQGQSPPLNNPPIPVEINCDVLTWACLAFILDIASAPPHYSLVQCRRALVQRLIIWRAKAPLRLSQSWSIAVYFTVYILTHNADPTDAVADAKCHHNAFVITASARTNPYPRHHPHRQ